MRQENFEQGNKYYHKCQRPCKKSTFLTCHTNPGPMWAGSWQARGGKKCVQMHKEHPMESRLAIFQNWQEEFKKKFFFWFTFSENFSPRWQGGRGGQLDRSGGDTDERAVKQVLAALGLWLSKVHPVEDPLPPARLHLLKVKSLLK